MSRFFDANDDYATAKKPFRVIACMPVHGRRPLLKHTIRRLYDKNGVYKVICAGDDPLDKEVCLENGAVWVQCENKPLGNKWNKAFEEAGAYNPDACLYVGSSDWLSDDWIHVMRPYVESHDFAGVRGMHLIDLGETKRLCHWPGYAFDPRSKARALESIGIGRMLSAKLMNKLQWHPFDPRLNSSLDHSMKIKAGIPDVFVPDLIALSISTHHWHNMHKFEQHYNGDLKSQRIEDVDGFLKLFPEINQIQF